MQKAEPPVVVDLDGTLLRGDSFLMALGGSFKRNFLQTTTLLFTRAFKKETGAAVFKWEIYKTLMNEKIWSRLKWNEPLIEKLCEWKTQGRKIILMTAAPSYFVDAVAEHLRGKIKFDDALGSTATQNRRAEKKAAVLVETFGAKNFDYIGNSQADLPVWRASCVAYNVNPSPGLINFAKKAGVELRLICENKQSSLMEAWDSYKRLCRRGRRR